MITFQELAESRYLLQQFCKLHFPSIEYFSAGLSFAVHREEVESGQLAGDQARHLTSSATCYNSLLECPQRYRPEDSRDIKKSSESYAKAALKRGQPDWTSDGSAPIYCRCRTLPFVIANISEWDACIDSHIRTILDQMDQPERFAIGEADPPDDPTKWYRPNAYHTYWALDLLDRVQRAFGTTKEYQKLDGAIQINKRTTQMQQWCRESLGYQVSLHSAESTLLDSDQLAWSLASVTRLAKALRANPAEQDFVKQAFKCLFGTQKKNGNWQHYAPLFHYKDTGNAYCYIFESFAELLRKALAAGAEFLRAMLKERFPDLMKLWKYAESTQIVLDTPTKALAWSSGHRINSPDAESWATASVFAYAQNLRRLVGIWAREEALLALPRKTPHASPKSAMETLKKRTRTWASKNTLTDELTSLFLHRSSQKRSLNSKGLNPINCQLKRTQHEPLFCMAHQALARQP
ncbi:MAG TPA: hypothetical protein VJN89_05685 [Candidatus Acidoferrum sp.]|nr:hypothetical protein [Candidatus Acidoferrum sp.]